MASITVLSDDGISHSEMLHHLERFLSAKRTAEIIPVECFARLKNLQESLSTDATKTISDVSMTKS